MAVRGTWDVLPAWTGLGISSWEDPPTVSCAPTPASELIEDVMAAGGSSASGFGDIGDGDAAVLELP